MFSRDGRVAIRSEDLAVTAAFTSTVELAIEPNAETLGHWSQTQDYLVWTECRNANERPLTLWQAQGPGVVRLPDNDALMHVIAAGVPHHIEGVFGYWRTCGADIVWLRAVRGEHVRYVLILGGSPTEYRNDVIQWICPVCASAIDRHEVKTRWSDPSRFWDREAEIVAAFNADSSRRSCPNCRNVHPLGYRFRRAEVRPDPETEMLFW